MYLIIYLICTINVFNVYYFFVFITAPSTEQKQPSSADPLKDHDYLGVRDLVSLQQLFDVRVHYVHKSGTRDQHMLPYIYGTCIVLYYEALY